MDEIKFEVLREFGKLSDDKFALEINYVKWNNNEPKYDIRKWSEDGKTAFKGISLNKKEFLKLVELLERALEEDKAVQPIYKGKFGKGQFVILINFGSVSENSTMPKTLTYIDWGHGAKYDIRPWTYDYKRCGKGVTIKESEAYKLIEIAKSINELYEHKKTKMGLNDIDELDLDKELFI